MTTDDPILRVRDLSRYYGGIAALDGVSIDVDRGSICALIGPNGAGKTTLLNCVTGHDVPTTGQIEFRKRSLLTTAAHQLPQLGVARTFQNLALADELTVLDNVRMGGYASNAHTLSRWVPVTPAARRTERQLRRDCDVALELLGLVEVAGRPSGDLPHGTRKRVELARVLMMRPSLVVLDEPAAGLSEAERNDVTALLELVRDEWGTAILIVEHQMEMLLGVCDWMHVLDFGRLIASGTPEDVRRNPDVIGAYLGGHGDA